MSKDQMRGKSEDGITHGEGLKRRDLLLSGSSLVAASALLGAGIATPAEAQQPAATSPGSDQYHCHHGGRHRHVEHRGLSPGMMAGRTPNLDRLAAEGMLFTDYYAEASCTAGRANLSPANSRYAPA